MLSKLLKYDFKSLAKMLVPFYGIALLLAAITRCFNVLADKFPIFSVPNGLIIVIFVVALIIVPVITFIFTIFKFYQSLVKDEGYLMHTIPVSKSSLILSKLISSICYLLLSVIIIFLALFIWGYGVWFQSDTIHVFLTFLGKIDSTFVILLLLSVFIEAIVNQIMIYAAIAFGQKHNSKVLYSIIYGVVLYNVTQLLYVIVLLPFMLFDSNYQQYVNSTTISDFGLINGFMAISIVISILFTVGYYLLTVKTFDKKLNLE